MKIIFLLVPFVVFTGCGGPSSSTPATSTPLSSAVPTETLLTRNDILAVLTKHGLNPETVPAPDVSKKMAEALAGIPNGTTDRFLLGIDKQGLMALGFGSIEDAKLMEARHKGDGFRHHNWYLGGLVPADVFNKTRDALRKG